MVPELGEHQKASRGEVWVSGLLSRDVWASWFAACGVWGLV